VRRCMCVFDVLADILACLKYRWDGCVGDWMG
jgi:hypothetical protein